MHTGLSAVPLTPVVDDRVDLGAYARLIEHVRDAGVESITALDLTA